eukprot:2170602-Heterocapsa_arctica.AAC.1
MCVGLERQGIGVVGSIPRRGRGQRYVEVAGKMDDGEHVAVQCGVDASFEPLGINFDEWASLQIQESHRHRSSRRIVLGPHREFSEVPSL